MIMRVVKKLFPNAELFCSFHRGILPDDYTSYAKSFFYLSMAAAAKSFGYKVCDVSSDLDKISFYDDCDLHVGYRVHAHLYFISKRKPSYLVSEDGRGEGMIRTMGLQSLKMNDPNLESTIGSAIDIGFEKDFTQFKKVGSFIDLKFEDMQRFLKSIR